MIKNIFKYFLYVCLIAFIIIQFFRPAKNTMEKSLALKSDLSTLYKIPNEVENLLQKSCYDCHTYNTDYPWYSKIQPVAWYLNNHVIDGKKHFNFNAFATYSLRKQYHKLEEIKEQIELKEMPLSSYTLIHQNAKLSPEDAKLICNWSDSVRANMEKTYPMDSLVKKK
jgi:hypothetical protein